MSERSLTYRDSGVDIEAGHALVKRIRPAAERTRRPEVLGNLGGFGSLFRFPTEQYHDPILVAGTDGIGTKLKLALEADNVRTLGVDLVAMCVNDVLVTGAEPLFFLDYYATGHLNVDNAAQVIEGVARGCEEAGCALVGGETAEMPGLYRAGDFDMAGFCVGAVERANLLDGSAITPGDAILGLASTGPHSNGYSLIRQILGQANVPLDYELAEMPLSQHLLAPTRIYVRTLLTMRSRLPVHGLAHITGGGLLENIPRILPEGATASIDTLAWPRPPIFEWLARVGNISEDEMLKVFNCGIGMVAIVPPEASDEAQSFLLSEGIENWLVGHIISGSNTVLLTRRR